MRHYGPVTVSKVHDSSDLKKLLPQQLLNSDIIIVKPTWYSPHLGNFTDAETLRMLLDALERKVVVTESYTLDRHDGTMKFVVEGEEVNWSWILKHPTWDWVKEGGRWEELRKQDAWFLDNHGFTDLFREFGVQYVNVTEEVWSGRTADVREVKERVESRFTPVLSEKLYGYVPEKLYRLKGAPLISFGKVKGIHGTFPSLSMKNLFGLIPDPLRTWWHGPKDESLGRSIVDIGKVYSTLFNVYGICEAIRYATVSHPRGEVKVPWGSYNIIKNLGVVALSSHLISLDAVLCSLIGVDPEKISYLELGEEVLGPYDRDSLDKAKLEAAEWFPV